MINLNQNTTTTFVLTLTEKVTIATPKYLFHFKNIVENKNYYCIIADTSTYTRRYNDFSFVEGTLDAINGKLILGAGGQYEYFVYEQSSTTNLDTTTLTDALLETGYMVLDRGNTTYNQHTIIEQYSEHQVT